MLDLREHKRATGIPVTYEDLSYDELLTKFPGRRKRKKKKKTPSETPPKEESRETKQGGLSNFIKKWFRSDEVTSSATPEVAPQERVTVDPEPSQVAGYAFAQKEDILAAISTTLESIDEVEEGESQDEITTAEVHRGSEEITSSYAVESSAGVEELPYAKEEAFIQQQQATPSVMDFGESDQDLEQTLDSIIGDTEIKIEAVREHVNEFLEESEFDDDDFEIEIEVETEDDDEAPAEPQVTHDDSDSLKL